MVGKRVSMAAGLRAEGSRMKAGHFQADRALTVWARRWGRADWVFRGPGQLFLFSTSILNKLNVGRGD